MIKFIKDGINKFGFVDIHLTNGQLIVAVDCLEHEGNNEIITVISPGNRVDEDKWSKHIISVNHIASADHRVEHGTLL